MWVLCYTNTVLLCLLIVHSNLRMYFTLNLSQRLVISQIKISNIYLLQDFNIGSVLSVILSEIIKLFKNQKS
jgi:hypothetical protein